MPTWEDLFSEGRLIEDQPQHEALKFAVRLESVFTERPLRVWDLCCGAGRHTEALAAGGHAVFSSDVSPTGVQLTRERLDEQKLSARLAVSDMTICPWPNQRFHGVLSWDALHHNTIDSIRRTVSTVHDHLFPGGHFLLTLKSTKADSFGKGDEIEPGTYVRDDGHESGVPHHFFGESEVRELFRGWTLLVVVEQIMDYRVRGPAFLEDNPFAYTLWGILAQREVGERSPI